MEPFVAQLKDLCAAHPTRAKWVFVPTHAVGRTIGDRLAIGGTDWANLRSVTPLDVALRMGAPFLVERGIDPSEEGLGPALIMRLLMGLPAGASYFRPLANQPQMAMALWSTLRELRQAGVRSSDLTAGAFASTDKHAELRALVDAYEKYRATSSRGDQAIVYDEAMRHLDWCPIRSTDCWTELPGVIWTPLQRRLIEMMPGERITPVDLDLPGVATPRRLTGARVERRAAEADVPLAFLMAPASVFGYGAAGREDSEPVEPAEPVEPVEPKVSLFQAGGPEAEVEEVFRRILLSGATLDEVEIACASEGYPTVALLDRISVDSAVRFGRPCVKGTRITVGDVLSYLAAGTSENCWTIGIGRGRASRSRRLLPWNDGHGLPRARGSIRARPHRVAALP